ncbi:hypothetical protein [Gilliamella sp. BG6]|uniref:hypothetical protein n=1 Tax=unclassified Gilliamella TaxID=2685620 RepID=UPI003987790D
MAIEKKLNDDYRNYCFNCNELEILLGFNLDVNELPNLKNKIDLVNNLPKELKPFLSRKTIQLKEAANIMAGYDPFHFSNRSQYCDDVKGYKASLWDAVDNNILHGKNIVTIEDFGQEWRDDITLNKNEVTKWANKYNFRWPLPIDEDVEELNQNNYELEQRIKQLEEELNKQRIINSNLEAIKSNEQVSVNNNQDLTEEIKQLKLDNQKLTEQLNKAQIKIEELKEQIPILLGKYRADDPLLLAIQIRNKEWSKYNEQDRRTRPTQDAICEALKANYNVQTDQLAKAIELVSCPINRSK